jgi:hypothetical protein
MEENSLPGQKFSEINLRIYYARYEVFMVVKVEFVVSWVVLCSVMVGQP